MPAIFSKFKDKLFYGWIIVIAGFLTGLVGIGIRYCFGVYFKSLESEFALTRAETSAIFSYYMIVAGIFSIIGGWAFDKYGPRKVIFVMGVIAGTGLILTSRASELWHIIASYSLLLASGTGATFPIVNSTASRWFNKKRGIAVALCSSGGAAGALVLAPVATFLISNFDWRTAFVVLGIASGLIMVFMSFFLRKDPSDMGLLPDGAKHIESKVNIRPEGLSLPEASRTLSFWFLLVVWIFLGISVHLTFTHVVPHATDLGISPASAAVIISLIGIAAIPGRIISGRMSDAAGKTVPAVFSGLLQVGSLVWLIWARELWSFYIFAVLFGFSWGGLGSQITIIISDVFGFRGLGAIMGALTVGWLIGAAIGPVVAGAIYDASHSYTVAFAYTAGSMVIATILMGAVTSGRTQPQKHSPTTIQNAF